MPTEQDRHAPELSVVIPTYRDPECLELALRSLARQTLPADRFEVVVVRDGDDAGYDAISDIAKPLQLRLVTLAQRRGRAAVRNEALRQVRAPVVLFLDSDSYLVPELLARHLAHHRDGPRVVIGRRLEIGPPQLEVIARGDPLPERGLDPLCQDVRFPTGDDDQQVQEVLRAPWLIAWAANVSVTRDLVTRVGGFDEGFGTRWGWEDPELFYRIYRELGRDAGAFRYDRTALCYHLPHYRDLTAWSQDYLDNSRHVMRTHPNLDWEFTGWTVPVDAARKIHYYRGVVADCVDSGACDVTAVWPWLADRLTTLGAADVVWIGTGTQRQPLGPAAVTLDHGRPPAATNFHLLGSALPMPDAAMDAVVNVNLWRCLGRTEFYNLLDESLRVAGALLLVSTGAVVAGRPAGYDELAFLARGLGHHFEVDLLAPRPGEWPAALQLRPLAGREPTGGGAGWR